MAASVVARRSLSVAAVLPLLLGCCSVANVDGIEVGGGVAGYSNCSPLQQILPSSSLARSPAPRLRLGTRFCRSIFALTVQGSSSFDKAKSSLLTRIWDDGGEGGRKVGRVIQQDSRKVGREVTLTCTNAHNNRVFFMGFTSVLNVVVLAKCYTKRPSACLCGAGADRETETTLEKSLLSRRIA